MFLRRETSLTPNQLEKMDQSKKLCLTKMRLIPRGDWLLHEKNKVVGHLFSIQSPFIHHLDF
ncbi:unnamed protein product [Larinioides sclopetarius]|uniref:Uncharacterized protein n=1 Tax=Larinioides sclopetarius TaxID=280406 RepID=A0AAV2BSV0_9ARAC